MTLRNPPFANQDSSYFVVRPFFTCCFPFSSAASHFHITSTLFAPVSFGALPSLSLIFLLAAAVFCVCSSFSLPSPPVASSHPDVRPFLQALLQALSEPFLDMLSSWCFAGAASDQHHEFFVSYDQGVGVRAMRVVERSVLSPQHHHGRPSDAAAADVDAAASHSGAGHSNRHPRLLSLAV